MNAQHTEQPDTKHPDTKHRGNHQRDSQVTTESGQATAEYALVMLAAAALAGLLIAWATGTDGIGRLLDAVMDSLISDAS